MNGPTLATRTVDEEFSFDRSQPASIDVQAVRDRIAWLTKQHGSMRVHRATFQAPWPLSRPQYEQFRKESVDTWLRVQEARGFTLRSKVHVDGPFPAYGYRGDWATVPLLDMREFHVKAAFSMWHTKPLRIELYVDAEGAGEE